MFVWFGSRKKTRVVAGGRTERAHCPDCDRQRRFVEVEIEETVHVYSVLNVSEESERGFRCTTCGCVGQIETDDGTRIPVGNTAAQTSAAADEAALAAERAQRQRERQERDEAEARRRARDRKRAERAADDELAALKKKMGLNTDDVGATEHDGEPSDADQAPKRKRFWQRWRK